MYATVSPHVETARRIVAVVRDRDVTFLAASVAYYAFISLVPSLLLLVAVASAVLGDAFATIVLAESRAFLTPAGQETVATAIASAEGRTGATLLGAVVLGWSTLKVFRGLDTAFQAAYGITEPSTLVGELSDAAVVAVGIGTGIVSMIVIGTLVAGSEILPAIADVPGVEVVGLLVLPVVLVVVFLPMYYVLPNRPMSVREAIPGTFLAAAGWTVLQVGFQAYAATAGQYQVYGVLGGILLLVTWLYLAAIVVIVGAVANAVIADRQLQGDPGRPTDMGDREDTEARATSDDETPRGAPDVAALEAEVRRLRADLDEFEDDVERRTVDRPRLETELKTYVRKRMRRGHARGWGPYLVLLYGTVLTLGAFRYLEGGYAIGAMLILGLSTLGLYTLFVLVGVGLNVLEAPGKAVDYVRNRGDD
ncbi:YihY/virulence factor BrkB family protein [Halopenitus persicus]|uniref:YihY family inner membrane protein n=1 Tax=Halopenitus persicus TaxID=1048396 RepID=A0A1H3KM88_9EURY|nr:YihY/virulence factor BrkB family protein [Halopenitus persicus]SDY53149.1 YihY family inner membrane protein [Halopenitus persicus]